MTRQSVVDRIPDEDYRHVHRASLVAGVSLTPQQERFVTLHCHGLGVASAARQCGMALSDAQLLLDSDEVQELLAYMRELHEDATRITRETVTVMLLEAYRKAGSASEEIAAAKELGKLHGLYKSDEQRGMRNTNNIQINGDVAISSRKMSRLSDEQLLQLAQLPQLPPIEGETG